MRATAVRRTALSACAVSLTLLATACGGSSDTEAEGGKADQGGATSGSSSAPTTSAPTTSAKALTAAELETASLKQGDVAGHKITKTGPDDEIPEGGVTVDKAACLPVAHAMYGVAQKGSAATAKRKVLSEPKKADTKKPAGDLTDGDVEDVLRAAFDVTSTFIALHAYEGTAGPDTFVALRKAAADCAGGFTATVGGEPQKVVSVTEEKATGGDESAAWTLTAAGDGGDQFPISLVALRKEGTVATFYSVNVAAVTGRSVKLTGPTEVVAAQAKKLG
ncbi:hypothetical protein J7F02_19835 [Streptomyces sp. ISL-112]|uniref:hypothetical protein n=1 Tax=unclassified Streptomyces TaxID=2593676 RepID=UPI001BEA4D64|nr:MULTISPECIES: hypothetical protein [unclassified Streptomyces]MBT2427849.1 hypothetical protein [Streptomyces sp. ISL-112]MBT2464640.1 hypothetical protein [Streptomyces sp. ISL-63]